MTSPTRTPLLHGFAALSGLALAMLVLGSSGRITLPFSLRTVPPHLVVEHAPNLTIYASSAGAAREGQQEVRHAQDRFRELFDKPPINLVVVLVDDPRHLHRMDIASLQRRRTAFLPFVTGRHLESQIPGSAGSSGASLKPLAHEACHVYLSALADRVAPISPIDRGEYGHHALPDWFDEASATLCESTEGRAIRRRRFRANSNRWIPLREFERIPHPLGSAAVLQRLGIDRSRDRVGIHVVPADQAERLTAGIDANLFYSQALSLGEFIAERGGPGVLGKLVQPLANGRTLDQALREAHRTAPSLPATVDELEVEWLRWVQRGVP